MADDSTYTYASPGDDGVFSDPVHEVRFLMKDTTQTAFSLTDQEIAFYLLRTRDDPADPTSVNERAAAAAAAEDRAALFAAQAKTNVHVGPFQVQKDYSQAAQEMRTLADSLRQGLASDHVAPVVATPVGHGVFAIGMTDRYYSPYGVPSALSI